MFVLSPIFMQIIKIIFVSFYCLCIHVLHGQDDCTLKSNIFTRQSQLDSFLILNPTCTIADTVVIEGEDISNLHALQNLQKVYSIKILKTNIKNLEGLENLSRCHSIEVFDNKMLSSLTVLQALQYANWVSIVLNENLKNLNGLSGDSLNNITISGNNKIQDLTGLDSKYCSALIVLSTSSLISLNGHNLDNLSQLIIAYNSNLSSLQSLNNLQKLKRLEFWNNISLSECSTSFICQKLQESDFILTNVYGNETGCNSVDQIKNGCISSVHTTSNEMIKIYPNPFSDIVNLEGLNENRTQYIIYNIAMQIVKAGYTTGIINTNDLDCGFYMMKLFNENHQEIINNIKLVKL